MMAKEDRLLGRDEIDVVTKLSTWTYGIRIQCYSRSPLLFEEKNAEECYGYMVIRRI